MHNPNPTSSHTVQVWQIQPDEADQRLDRYLASALPERSRTNVQHLIADKAILVNGQPSKPAYLLRPHDQIQALWTIPIAQQAAVKPQALPLEIVYEDSDLLVLNKAAGMVVHPAPGHAEDTLVNALVARYPELQEVGSDRRPGIVHRLDKDTSGLLIVARNTQTLVALTGQMKRHEVVKRYLALVEGIVSLDEGTIDAPIGRNRQHRQQMTITATEGREARTHFRVLQRFAHHTLLLLQLETGRTHQIRVHLKAIGHPVAGDPVYGSGNTRQGVTLQRQFLHSYQLKLIHPLTGVPLEFEAPLPADLQTVLDKQNIL
jgi:23S rRNA pseudouridine1911/1915/1917 synthase